MSKSPDAFGESPFLDGESSRLGGEDVLRELRLQIEAVKARVEEHRETMEAVGLTSSTRSRERDESEGRA